MKILKEDVKVSQIAPRGLTTDCKFVQRASGEIDLVKAHAMVHVFDYYWDRGIKVTRIWHSGGTRNPKFQEPEF
jgi:hypothetical protein